MNIRYKIRHSRPKLIKVKGLACLRALLSNESVETTLTHVDLTASKYSTDKHKSENRGNPFRVSGIVQIFPLTYHQGVVQ